MSLLRHNPPLEELQLKDEDLYAVLGVLPDAEAVVITAAFRALASKYHPDRWTGDPAVAHARMSQVNRAYEVLGDAARRAAYDASRNSKTSASFEQQEQEESTFDEATRDLEQRWAVAVAVIPELTALRQRLAKTSHQLAFAFVVTLLDTRRFDQALAMADALEAQFLERYFGTDPEVIQFAKLLIGMGDRKAVRRLNQLVDVMGSHVEAKLITGTVDREFQIYERLRAGAAAAASAANQNQDEQLRKFHLQQLKKALLERRELSTAVSLAEALGYEVICAGGGLMPTKVTLRRSNGYERYFYSAGEFIRWAAEELACQ